MSQSIRINLDYFTYVKSKNEYRPFGVSKKEIIREFYGMIIYKKDNYSLVYGLMYPNYDLKIEDFTESRMNKKKTYLDLELLYIDNNYIEKIEKRDVPEILLSETYLNLINIVSKEYL